MLGLKLILVYQRFFNIDYQYSITRKEHELLADTGNVIFERIYVYGFIIGATPARPNEDLDLKIEAKPIFVSSSSDFQFDQGRDVFIRSRQRNLKEPSQRVRDALNVQGLDQVRCRLELTVGQFDYSNKEDIV